MNNAYTFNDMSTRELSAIQTLMAEATTFEEFLMKLSIVGWSDQQKNDLFSAFMITGLNEIKQITHDRKYKSNDNYTTYDVDGITSMITAKGQNYSDCLLNTTKDR